MSFTFFFFLLFNFVLLVGLEPINGFHENKNIAANDQLPSTEPDQSITDAAAVASTSPTATATSASAMAQQQQQQLTQPSASLQTEVTAPTAASSVSTSSAEISSITPMPMEIDDDAPPNIDLSTGVDSSDVPQVDLESDVLREFLENDTTDLSATDDVGIEQMLMA